MDLAGYTGSLQRMMQENAAGMGLPAGTALSLPMAVRHGAGFLDAIFFFELPPSSGRPFAWALLDPVSGITRHFSWCDTRDFVPDGAYPHDMVVPLETPLAVTPQQKADGRRELLGLYEKLRPFVFSPAPTEEERAHMERFARLFEAIAYTGHRPFYRALSPDFLGWLGLSLSGGPEPAVGAGAAVDDRLSSSIQELSELFRRKIMNDEHKQRMFDEIHSELQSYKNGLIDTLTRPMEGDIIKLIDDIEKSMDHYRGRQFTPDNYRRLMSLFEGVGTDLVDLLYRHGLEPFSQEGDDVDVGRQKVLATMPTEKKRQDKKVAVRHSKGWEKNGKIIRAERVSVYVYTPPDADKVQ